MSWRLTFVLTLGMKVTAPMADGCRTGDTSPKRMILFQVMLGATIDLVNCDSSSTVKKPA